MKLRNVSLEKTDTCITYCLKRLGYVEHNLSYQTMKDHFDYKLFRDYGKLNVGDILLWDKNIHWEWIPWQITELGIVNKHIPIGFHFAIFEGSGLISDVTRRTGTPPHFPFLRMRNATDIKRTPDWVLTISVEK